MAAPSPTESPTDTLIDTVAPVVDVVGVLLLLAAGAAVAHLLHLLVVRVVFRFGAHGALATEMRSRCRWPARATSTLLGILAAVPLTDLDDGWRARVLHLLAIGIIVAGAWLAVRAAEATEAAVLSQVDDGSTRLLARRRRTQATLLRRVAVAFIVILGAAAILLTFDAVRTVGASLLASAGVLGIVAGIAAQNSLGNLVAGLQIAFAEPLRLDDVVVVEGEWGTIEEITLTYVVVRTWDLRRLILPTSYFVQEHFQNWTRSQTQIAGTVVWHLDHRAPIEVIRRRFEEVVGDHPLWDGDTATLQVVDTTERTVVVRGLVTAADAGAAWNLRCDVRETMITWLRDHHPAALPTTRLLEAAPAPDEGPPPGQ